jgi:molybdate transport system permease protein
VNVRFYAALGLLGGSYVALIVALLVADAVNTSPEHLAKALASPEIRSAILLSLVSCSISAAMSILVAVPLGYLLARTRFPGRAVLDWLVDVPIVLPPVVLGLSLLILFQTPPGLFVQQRIPITYAVPAVILAQFTAAAAFAVRSMRGTFEQLSPRTEGVALTLGCTRAQAFWRIAIPEARRGILAAGTLAWAKSLGEFGPVLLFAGATRNKTEVLSTSVFFEMSVGNLEAALAVSVLMIAVALAVLGLLRGIDRRRGW